MASLVRDLELEAAPILSVRWESLTAQQVQAELDRLVGRDGYQTIRPTHAASRSIAKPIPQRSLSSPTALASPSTARDPLESRRDRRRSTEREPPSLSIFTTPRRSAVRSTPAILGVESASSEPLFPPSPPPSRLDHPGDGSPGRVTPKEADLLGYHGSASSRHPVVVLAALVHQLQAEIQELRGQQTTSAAPVADKPRDLVSLHESINDAISTSLGDDTPSVFTDDTTVTPRRHRSRSGIQRLRPSSTYDSPDPGSRSWTETLSRWGLGRPRHSSIVSESDRVAFLPPVARASVAVQTHMQSPETSPDAFDPRSTSATAGNSPAFEAIFLATRILTPDLFSASLAGTSPIIAAATHRLVGNARDRGIELRSRRGSANSNHDPFRPSVDKNARDLLQTLKRRPTERKVSSTPMINVELDAIIAPEERPPTLRRSQADVATQYKVKDLTPYTDRYGFVYDMRYVRMMLDLQHAADTLREHPPSQEPSLEMPPVDAPAVTSSKLSPGLSGFMPSPPRPVSAPHTLHVSSQGSRSLQPTLTSDRTFSATLRSKADKLDRLAMESKTPVTALLAQLTDVHDKHEEERLKQWRHLLKSQTSPSSLVPADARKFRKLVRKTGIPIALRDRIWAECSGATDAFIPGEYQEIISIHANDEHPVLGEIEKDVRRTFPNNIFFGGDGAGCEKLRRLLTAYAWNDPSIGYCQGMNLVAATLLLTCEQEEQAYWIFHCVIKSILPEDWFSPDLTGSMAEQDVLNDFVQLLLPAIPRHLEDLGIELSAVTFGWLLSMFTSCLPIETLLRVWDCIMVEGRNVSPVVLGHIRRLLTR